jgi:hypothetical protein
VRVQLTLYALAEAVIAAAHLLQKSGTLGGWLLQSQVKEGFFVHVDHALYFTWRRRSS